MSQQQPGVIETDNAQEPLDFTMETLQDLDVRGDANVRGGAGAVAPIAQPGQNTHTNPGTIRMTIATSGTSVILPGH
mgnify:CR=1 FL=1